MPYAYITFAQLRTQLANRLNDPSKIYWPDVELQLAIREALRYWQCMTMFWKNRFTFNSVLNTSWYDLTAQAGTLIPYTVTDSEVTSFLLYNVIEPQLSGGLYVGTDMFTLADITQALQRRRNQFLLETGMVTGRSVISLPAPPENKIPLADSIIDVKRVAFIDTGGVYTTLWRSDEWAAQSFRTGWFATPDTPAVFSTAVVPPVTLILIPPPVASGTAELIAVSTGADLNPGVGVLLGIPDDFTWVVRMGALADLLGREGQSRDADRAQYCQSRWTEGVALAKIFTSIETAYLDGVQVYVQSIRALSAFRAGWQNEPAGTPDTLGMMSWNLVALAAKPDAGPHSIMVDTVQNAPVPSADGDFIQLGREDLDALLDYAQHLLAFKQGGDEFMATVPLYQNAVTRGKAGNDKIRSGVPFFGALSNRATRQEAETMEPSAKTQ